jgi:hypothetical protein
MRWNVLCAASFLALLVAVVAACSQSSGPVAPSARLQPSLVLIPATRATPIGFFYGVNFASNDVSQFVLQSGGRIRRIAIRYALPPKCHPDDIVLAGPYRAFVTCYGGPVVMLKIGADHTVASSGVAPVPVSSPLSIIAPQTGVPGRLYVDGFGKLSVLAYTGASLRTIKTYKTGFYPDEMTLYTDRYGTSTLYVAANETALCGAHNVSGAIEAWTQNRGGFLSRGDPIATCGRTFNVIAFQHYLLWAGPGALGWYDLNRSKTLSPPPPFWPAQQGPQYSPAAMSVSKPIASSAPGSWSVTTKTGQNVVDGTTFTSSVTLAGRSPATQPVAAGQCQDFALPTDPPSKALIVNGTAYRQLCWHFEGNDLVVAGIELQSNATHVLARIGNGDRPVAIEFRKAGDYGT